MTLSGGCQCGAVRYRLLAQPTDPSICHCRMCQKASGQPFMAFGGVPLAKLEWTRGELATFRSSSAVERGFCRDCGTPLTYRVIGKDRISVALASLDDPEAVPPEKQYGNDTELSWFAGLRELPRDENVWPDFVKLPIVSHQHPDRDT